MARKRKSATAGANKWAAGMSGGGAAWQAGCKSPTRSVTQGATANLQKALTNVTRAFSAGGNYVMAMSNPATDQTWSTQTASQKSLNNFNAAGSDPVAKSRFQSFLNNAQPTYDAMDAASQSAGTDPVAKVSAALRILIAAGYKSGGPGLGRKSYA
jgi:hypothetical protein